MTSLRAELAEMQTRVDTMAARIGLQPRHLPTFGASDQDARPAVLYDGQWHYVIAERGHDYSRETTDQAQALLYLVFHDAAGFEAGEYELAHRQPGRDSRRIRFERHIELLTQLDEEWGRRQRSEIEKTLTRYPYNDVGSQGPSSPSRRHRPPILLLSLAVGFNILAGAGCAALIIVAPGRAGVLLAVVGMVFFGLAAVGFALMLRAALTTSGNAAAERRAR